MPPSTATSISRPTTASSTTTHSSYDSAYSIARRQLVDVVRLADADRRAHVRRLHEARQTELGGERGRRSGVIEAVLAQRAEAGLGDAVGGEHLLGHRLVHRQGRPEHASADVGDVGQLEHPLHRAVLAHRAVQQRQHDGDLVVGAGGRAPRWPTPPVPTGRAVRAGLAGPAASATWAASPSAHSPLVEMPIGVTRYRAGSMAASTCDAVDAADVVLGRLAAVQHDEVDAAHWLQRSPRGARSARLTATTVLTAAGGRGRTVHGGGTVRPVRFRASDVAAATGGRLVGADVDARRGVVRLPHRARRVSCSCRSSPTATVTTSSRRRPAPGAGAYLTARPPDPAVAIPAIEVGDTGAALMDAGGLGACAAWARRSSPSPAASARRRPRTSPPRRSAPTRRVTANARSFNNEQGLPVTVLGAADDTEILVLEMGMRGFGEIARLAAVAPPDVGIVTSVGPAHGERVGGIEGVARAKAELVEALAERRHGGAQRRRRHGCGRWPNAPPPTCCSSASRATPTCASSRSASTTWPGRPFRIHTPWGADEVRLAVSGRHMAIDAALAVAAAGAVRRAAVRRRHGDRRGRGVSRAGCDVHHLASGAIVIDDAYNANPMSMRAGARRARRDRRRAVASPSLGVMAELAEPRRGPPRDRRTRRRPRHRADRRRHRPLRRRAGRRRGRGPRSARAAGTAVLVKGSLVAGLQALAARLVATG